MKKLNLNSLDFQSIDKNFRITISWDKDTFPNFILSQAVNINALKAYKLDGKRLKFAKKYHIPFKDIYYSLEEINAFSLLLDEYEELIIEAEALKIDWDFSKFDFEGLTKAISEEMEKKNNKNDSNK